MDGCKAVVVPGEAIAPGFSFNSLRGLGIRVVLDTDALGLSNAILNFDGSQVS